ncbi:hypothetical protein J27TS8_23660 [Robertmurraya siralis]|uniref:Uncharacterized protein n=1 Tax=Robertmurraya siralis TaxID=77777 RepID=A0A920BTW7_9BACI|nr:hypothetical protein J27TS8_23660 [Robertmurraya siralis]
MRTEKEEKGKMVSAWSVYEDKKEEKRENSCPHGKGEGLIASAPYHAKS